MGREQKMQLGISAEYDQLSIFRRDNSGDPVWRFTELNHL